MVLYLNIYWLNFLQSSLTLEQIEEIEKSINKLIKKKVEVKRVEMPFEELIDDPCAVILRGEVSVYIAKLQYCMPFYIIWNTDKIINCHARKVISLLI